jgi:hypothetical protein
MWRFTFCVGIVALALTTASTAVARETHNGNKTYILYEDDHKDRAMALASAYKDKYAAPVNDGRDGIKVDGEITKLTVWGHGNQMVFCGMSADDFVKLILAWKKKHSKLTTVEIITCDARHNPENNSVDPYAKKVAKEVSKTHKSVKIFALALGQSEKSSSILWASAKTSTFCYMTAPNKTALEQANEKLLDAATPTEDFIEAAKKLLKEKGRKYSIHYAKLEKLRTYLVEVKK